MIGLSRRRFLALAATAAAGAACSDGDGATYQPPTTAGPAATDRVPEATDATGPEPSAPATEPPPTSTAVEVPPLDVASDPFALGVASGDPAPGRVVLWTRLVGELGDTDHDVLWELADDESFTTTLARGIATAAVADGHSVHVDVELDGAVWFRFRAGEWASPIGRAAPAPDRDAPVESLRIASASCQNWEDGYYTAYADVVAWQPDLVLFLGDFIYEGASSQIGDAGVVRVHRDGEPTTVDAYRQRYALYLSDPLLRAARAACPWLVVWDDHEVENNYAGTVPQDPSDGVDFPARRDAAYRAWWEHMPVRLPRPEPGQEYPIYRDVAWGQLATILLLDGRQYRDDQACGDATLNFEPACDDVRDPSRTMLGVEQEVWLAKQLAASDTTWRVVGQQTVMSDVGLPNGAVLNFDQWDGYPAARGRLLASMSGLGGIVVVTGDIHLAGVGELAGADGVVVGAEFVTTSISSSGLVDASLQAALADFPAIVDAELGHRGYTQHTVTPTEWVAEYRIVDDVTREGAPVSTWRRFRVTPTSPIVEPLA
jgi:alkaline phosphatase D